MQNLKIAVIVDRGALQKFGRDAVDAVEGTDEITVFSCTNTRFPLKPGRHGLYYVLNLLSVRNPLTRTVPIAGTTKRIAEIVEFASIREGGWQALPPEIVERLAGFDIVLKFGMGLLRVPPRERLATPILSYHHGDPDHYRGRPAGFWEMVNGAPVVGQIVQVIENRLDAGKVVAFAETRLIPHSYRATLKQAYRHSPLILNQAIRNALAGSFIPKESNGRNYRLPSNLAVARFLAAMAVHGLRRLVYGAFFEKRWRVSLADAGGRSLEEIICQGRVPPPSAWRTLEVPRRYSFYADPVFSRDPPGLLVEGVNRATGAGEIVLVRGGEHVTVSRGPGHFSYPAIIATAAGQRVVPEIAQWSGPRAYRLDGDALVEEGRLRIEGAARIADPTLVEHEGRLYLFGSPRHLGTNVLWLWSADSLDSVFRPHPLNAIRISPRGARMAGAIVVSGGCLYRLGQSFERSYGDGVHLFEVTELSPDTYSERLAGSLRFDDRRGPHMLNLDGGTLLFDWYCDAFAPLAGVRRLLARMRRSRRS